MNNQEAKLQAQCFQWHWNTYPSERRMLHCNNNNSSSLVEGNRNKAMGVVKGISDMEYILPDGQICFIEFKVGRNKQSPEQIDFEMKCKARGHWYIIITSFEQFKALVWNIIGS